MYFSKNDEKMVREFNRVYDSTLASYANGFFVFKIGRAYLRLRRDFLYHLLKSGEAGEYTFNCG